MIVMLAAGLLLIAVVLLVLRPLLAPRAPVVAAGERRHATTGRTGGTPHERADAGGDVPSDVDALELAIAERRARMAAREEGRR
jgi:hypothetical protein